MKKTKKPIMITKVITLLLTWMMMSSAIAGDAHQQLVKADKALNTAYRQVMSKYKSDRAFSKKLRAIQRLWIQFRDAEVKTKFLSINDSIQLDKNYPEPVAAYLAQLTAQRSDELREWLSDDISSCQIADVTSNQDYLENDEVNIAEILRLQKRHSDITGTYEDEFSRVQLVELSDNRVFFDLDLSNGRNMGNLEGFVDKNNMRYQNNEYGLCKFSITHSGKQITIKTLDNGLECGYGSGVYSDGTFAFKSKQVKLLDDLDNADSDLNYTYQEIMAKYKGNPKFIKRLRVAQRLWIKLRDAKVNAHFPNSDSLCQSIYTVQLTEQRINELKNYLNK